MARPLTSLRRVLSGIPVLAKGVGSPLATAILILHLRHPNRRSIPSRPRTMDHRHRITLSGMTYPPSHRIFTLHSANGSPKMPRLLCQISSCTTLVVPPMSRRSHRCSNCLTHHHLVRTPNTWARTGEIWHTMDRTCLKRNGLLARDLASPGGHGMTDVTLRRRTKRRYRPSKLELSRLPRVTTATIVDTVDLRLLNPERNQYPPHRASLLPSPVRHRGVPHRHRPLQRPSSLVLGAGGRLKRLRKPMTL